MVMPGTGAGTVAALEPVAPPPPPPPAVGAGGKVAAPKMKAGRAAGVGVVPLVLLAASVVLVPWKAKAPV